MKEELSSYIKLSREVQMALDERRAIVALESPVIVTCAGAKSILDLDLTLEYLETHGIPVIGWQTNEFPAFYVRSSGRHLPHRLDDVNILAATVHAQWACGLNGIVVACPIPEQ